MAKKIPPKESAVKAISSVVETGLEVSPEGVSEIRTVCKRIGMGIEDYLCAIKRGLTARKIVVDKFGEEQDLGDDHEKQLKAALAGLEVEGYIKAKSVTNDNSKHTHVTYQWKTDGGPGVQIVQGVSVAEGLRE